jgi:hypothetical protein
MMGVRRPAAAEQEDEMMRDNDLNADVVSDDAEQAIPAIGVAE